MKLSNKNRADIKKNQNKNFKKFLEEANPMVTKKIEPFDLIWETPKRNKLHFNVWIYILVAIVVIVGVI